MPLDTFYAHTDTFVEVPLAALLLPGTYTVRLTLDDEAQGASVDERAIALVVLAPAVAAVSAGVLPGLTGVIQGTDEGQISLPIWGVVIVAGLLLGGVVLGLLVLARRRRRARISER